VRAAGLHLAPLREFIHLLKYEERPDLAAPLARYLVAALGHPDWDDLQRGFDAVVPVPLHPERRKERGYNQAELLAGALCQRTGLSLQAGLLRRDKHTHSQVGLNAEERRANVEDAFDAAPACAGRRLLLIEDVYTTGATLEACAEAAVASGARLVCGLTLAMAV
jgi:ComF family protein